MKALSQLKDFGFRVDKDLEEWIKKLPAFEIVEFKNMDKKRVAKVMINSDTEMIIEQKI